MLTPNAADLAIMARARRAELRLGQADVAKAAGVGRQWISKFEAGEESVEFGMALRTLAILGIEVRACFTAPPPPWTRPLTAAAGTRSHPYGRHRRSRRPLKMSPQGVAPRAGEDPDAVRGSGPGNATGP